jgi:L-iditol 2-dehydrogenase
MSMLRKLKDITVIDGASEDSVAIVRERTNGMGADIVIVAGPTREAHESSVHLVRRGGGISLFASLPSDDPDITFNSRTLHYGELRIVGASDSRPEHVATGLRLMAEGKIDADAVITHIVSLEDIQDGLDLMIRKESLKVLVQP